jgi:hypothetical protein
VATDPEIEEAEIITDEGYDASDPVQVGNARKRAGQERREELEMVSALMKLPQGRRWLYNKLVLCKTFTTPFAVGYPDQTAFNAGVQSIGHILQEDIMKAAPDLYWTMIMEGSENSKRRTRK